MEELLFSYGTLKDPQIQKKIAGREFIGYPDILENHTVEQIILDDGVYPILTKKPGREIPGILLYILSTDFLQLDAYEGSAYKRVSVYLKSGKKSWVYMKNERYGEDLLSN